MAKRKFRFMPLLRDVIEEITELGPIPMGSKEDEFVIWKHRLSIATEEIGGAPMYVSAHVRLIRAIALLFTCAAWSLNNFKSEDDDEN